ncbi:MAG: EamA family transporter [Spirochaetales bacterium]|nr:EamA family transporter [Spirochaetales bacterium]
MTYLWTMFISAFLLKEKLNKWNFIGIGLIFCGIFILGTLKTV